jgi:FKBP-type peptidyl-prolyl cis-trans isomerase FklB
VVDGFSTALQNMHRGDYWRVIVPYQLGYNKESKTGIPAYSTLVFDIWLVDFWHKEPGDRDE